MQLIGAQVQALLGSLYNQTDNALDYEVETQIATNAVCQPTVPNFNPTHTLRVKEILEIEQAEEQDVLIALRLQQAQTEAAIAAGSSATEAELPMDADRINDYNQACVDLGAMLPTAQSVLESSAVLAAPSLSDTLAAASVQDDGSSKNSNDMMDIDASADAESSAAAAAAEYDAPLQNTLRAMFQGHMFRL
jgi:hypothetical protein